jgi:hypothetical protein
MYILSLIAAVQNLHKVAIMEGTWDIRGQNERISQIGNELARLLAQQTEFFKKGARAKYTPEELREYEESRDRVRELFAELERLTKAAY